MLRFAADLERGGKSVRQQRLCSKLPQLRQLATIKSCATAE